MGSQVVACSFNRQHSNRTSRRRLSNCQKKKPAPARYGPDGDGLSGSQPALFFIFCAPQPALTAVLPAYPPCGNAAAKHRTYLSYVLLPILRPCSAKRSIRTLTPLTPAVLRHSSMTSVAELCIEFHKVLSWGSRASLICSSVAPWFLSLRV